MRRVLVLRPEPGATETVGKARQRGLDAVALPLFKMEPVAWNMPDVGRFDALLLTSANAVRQGGAGLAQLQSLPVHAVGNATADAARNAGLAVASIGDGGVDALLASLEPGLRVLHLCGEDRRAPADARPEIRSLVVYRSRELSLPNINAAKDCLALIHSPRAGRRFAELIDDTELDRRSIMIAAISPAAAEAAGIGWAAIEAADAPNNDALLALAERLCNKLGA
jgi:uroporphyrinogen-III synthase